MGKGKSRCFSFTSWAVPWIFGTPFYSKITCPALVIGCLYDTIRPPQEVEPIARQIPGATYVEAESGHFMPHQTPELFLDMALSFLKEAA